MDLYDFIDDSALNNGQLATLEQIYDELSPAFEDALDAARSGDASAFGEFAAALGGVEVDYLSEVLADLGDQVEEVLEEVFEKAVMEFSDGLSVLELILQFIGGLFD